MDIQAITKLLQDKFPDGKIEAEFEGSHLQLTIVSEAFLGLTPLKKQRLVYEALNDKIACGEIHAVNMKTLTPDQV